MSLGETITLKPRSSPSNNGCAIEPKSYTDSIYSNNHKARFTQ